MREDDRDLVALFAEEPLPARDPALVAAVAQEVVRLSRRRAAVMSACGLALGLGGGATVALAAPLLGQTGRLIGEAARAPEVMWAAFAAGLLLALAAPLLARR